MSLDRVSIREASKRYLVTVSLISFVAVIAIAAATYSSHPRGDQECKSINQESTVGREMIDSRMRTSNSPSRPENPSLELQIPLSEERTLRLPISPNSTLPSTATSPSPQLPPVERRPWINGWSVRGGTQARMSV
ncbi:MAG: hypothetical protein [Sanya fiers-like virus 5]|nr:MAG: hypothetical protein [Sanya fiers-like virus 5]UUW21197.1 MAG: hypothetical protein [Sanya fiers-like virus 5]